jgi:hypothetical protein
MPTTNRKIEPFYAPEGCKYNRLNINNPQVRELAERYCKKHGTTVDYLIHHKTVRDDFEAQVIAWANKQKEKAVK